jgi:hypothetical protein
VSFILKGCLPQSFGARSLSSEGEDEMLMKWHLLRGLRPDIITGYNVQNFDIPCSIGSTDVEQKNRYDEGFPQLGEDPKLQGQDGDTTFQSSAYGKHK